MAESDADARSTIIGAVVVTLIVITFLLYLAARALSGGGPARRAERILQQSDAPEIELPASSARAARGRSSQISPATPYRTQGGAMTSAATGSAMPLFQPGPTTAPLWTPAAAPQIPPAAPADVSLSALAVPLNSQPAAASWTAGQELLASLRAGVRAHRMQAAGRPPAPPREEREEFPLWIPQQEYRRFDRLARELGARVDLSWEQVREEPDRHAGVILALRAALLGRMETDEEEVFLFELRDGDRLRLRLKNRDLPLPVGEGYRLLVRHRGQAGPELLAVISDPTVETPTARPYTGLIVDARGLGIERLPNPAIVAGNGRVLIQRASAGDPEDARLPTVAGSQPISLARDSGRVGDHPLVLRAVAGGYNARGGDVMLSLEDTRQVQAENRSGRFLEGRRVVILLDE